MNLDEDVSVSCPVCGEPFAIQVDTTGGSYETIEDCAVCCRPISIMIQCRPGEILSLSAEPS